jgi:hypothetical protein
VPAGSRQPAHRGISVGPDGPRPDCLDMCDIHANYGLLVFFVIRPLCLALQFSGGNRRRDPPLARQPPSCSRLPTPPLPRRARLGLPSLGLRCQERERCPSPDLICSGVHYPARSPARREMRRLPQLPNRWARRLEIPSLFFLYYF